MKRITPLGNLPAAYECILAKGDVAGVLSMVWLVPGGAVVYVHAVCTLEDTHTDEFWERTAGRIQQHLRTAKGVTTHPDMALSYQPSRYQESYNVPTPQGYEGTRNEDGAFDLYPIGGGNQDRPPAPPVHGG